VMEDDAVLGNEFASSVQDALGAVPSGWDFLHLSGAPAHAVKCVVDVGATSIVRYSRVPSGTVGYVITLEGARKLLRPIARRWPLDTDIRQPWQFGLDIYGVSPAIIAHDDLAPSAILSFGERSRLRRGLRPGRGSMTGNPFKTTESLVFNARKLGPVHWLRCLYVNSMRRSGTWAAKVVRNAIPIHN
jgi:GR25 family glycosyltransferase involved in LPS biosynthesis